MSPIDGIMRSLHAQMITQVVTRIAENMRPDVQDQVADPMAPTGQQGNGIVHPMPERSIVLADASGMDFTGSSLVDLGLPATTIPARSSASDLAPRIADKAGSLDLHVASRASVLPGNEHNIHSATLAHILTGSTQVERADIIASFILNAAMIPGWPAPTMHGFDPKDTIGTQRMSLNRLMTEDEALTYLANLGVDQGLMGKLRKRFAKFKRGKALILALATLLKTLAGAFDVLASEVASAIEEQQNYGEGRQRADGHGGRHWISLD